MRGAVVPGEDLVDERTHRLVRRGSVIPAVCAERLAVGTCRPRCGTGDPDPPRLHGSCKNRVRLASFGVTRSASTRMRLMSNCSAFSLPMTSAPSTLHPVATHAHRVSTRQPRRHRPWIEGVDPRFRTASSLVVQISHPTMVLP